MSLFLKDKIDPDDFLKKKFYRGWFFTNERIGPFFPKLEKHRNLKKVFAIGGSGDFVFSLLASSISEQIEEINICDLQPAAILTFDLKSALFRNLEYEEILNLFSKPEIFSKEALFKRVEGVIFPFTKEILDFIFSNCKKNNFLQCLKKSGLWYRHSFWQIKYKKDYLFYLTSKENYQRLQENLDKIKITIYYGDFNENLTLFQNEHYDLIYISNILDSKKYCLAPALYLTTIRNKLTKDGLLFVVSQENPRKITKLIEKAGFSLWEKEWHRFNIISSLLGHYSFSFFLFKNIY